MMLGLKKRKKKKERKKKKKKKKSSTSGGLGQRFKTVMMEVKLHSFGTTTKVFSSSWTVWTPVVLFGPLWFCLDPCGSFWTPVVLFGPLWFC